MDWPFQWSNACPTASSRLSTCQYAMPCKEKILSCNFLLHDKFRQIHISLSKLYISDSSKGVFPSCSTRALHSWSWPPCPVTQLTSPKHITYSSPSINFARKCFKMMICIYSLRKFWLNRSCICANGWFQVYSFFSTAWSSMPWKTVSASGCSL